MICGNTGRRYEVELLFLQCPVQTGRGGGAGGKRSPETHIRGNNCVRYCSAAFRFSVEVNTDVDRIELSPLCVCDSDSMETRYTIMKVGGINWKK